jgi:hypothetical protein
MAVVLTVLRCADPRITSERYAHLDQNYLTAEMRKLSLLSRIEPPSTQISAGAKAAANCDSENSVNSVDFHRAADGIRTRDPELGKPARGL